MCTERFSRAPEGSQKVLGEEGVRAEKWTPWDKGHICYPADEASTLLREQLRSGLHRAWCLDPAPHGQEKSAKTERSAGRASVINISWFQKVYNFLKESIFSEEIYKITCSLECQERCINVVVGKIGERGKQRRWYCVTDF